MSKTMAKVKSRGNDVSSVETQGQGQQKPDIRRLANLGKTIELQFGEVTVREPSLEKVIAVLSDLLPLANLLKDVGSNPLLLLSDPETLPMVKRVASKLTDTDQSDFEELPISDWLLLIATLKEVVDFEKLQELFQQLGLTELMGQSPDSQ